MGATFLIALREGLETVLIIGIVLGMLQRLGQDNYRKTVWVGIFTAVVISAAVGLSLNALGITIPEAGEELFEGIIMLAAVGVLTWMIFWMQSQGRKTQTSLEAGVKQALVAGSNRAIFLLAFLAVLREGVETALFLTAASFGATAIQTWAGVALGFAVAIILGFMLFAGGRKIDLQRFFLITGILLLLFAAGMFARGIHELQEAKVLPELIEHVWDINGILNEDGTVGSFLKTLFGYNGNPSLLDVISYVAYLVIVGFFSLKLFRPKKPTEIG